MLSHPRGNLIQNPGFELALEFWNCPQSTPSLIRSNVAATARFSHSGVGSALLGDNGRNSSRQSIRMSQSLPATPTNRTSTWRGLLSAR